MGGQVPRHPVVERAGEADAGLPPGGRDDVLLHIVALDAEEARRFVGLVELADGDEEDAGARRRAGREIVFDERLFDFDLAGLAVAGERMFDLEFAGEAQVVGEIVAEEKHEPVDVDLVFLAAVVMDLAITAELRVAPPAARVLTFHQGRFDEIARRLNLDIGFEQALAGLLDAGVVAAHPFLKLLDDRLLLTDDLPHFLARRHRVLRDSDGGQNGQRGKNAQGACDGTHGIVPFRR